MENTTINTDPTTVAKIILTDPDVLAKVNAVFRENTLIPSIVFIMILMCLGAPGNLLVFTVYFSRWRRTTSRVFIIALSICDMYNCFVSMPIEIFYLMNYVQSDTAVLCKVSRFMTFLFNDASALILVGIAFDRFFRICRPFQKQMGSFRAKIVCFVAFLISLATCWPAILLYGTQTIPLPIGQPGMFVAAKLCLLDENFVKTNYPFIFSTVIMSCNIIIDVIIIVLYSAVAYTVMQTPKIVRQMSIQRQNSSNGNDPRQSARRSLGLQRSVSINQEEHRRKRMIKTTIMLFVVSLVFMLSFVPYVVIVEIRNRNPKHYPSLSKTGKMIYHLFLRTYFLNSAMNPVIYSFLSEQFRTECKAVLEKLKFWRM